MRPKALCEGGPAHVSSPAGACRAGGESRGGEGPTARRARGRPPPRSEVYEKEFVAHVAVVLAELAATCARTRGARGRRQQAPRAGRHLRHVRPLERVAVPATRRGPPRPVR